MTERINESTDHSFWTKEDLTQVKLKDLRTVRRRHVEIESMSAEALGCFNDRWIDGLIGAASIWLCWAWEEEGGEEGRCASEPRTETTANTAPPFPHPLSAAKVSQGMALVPVEIQKARRELAGALCPEPADCHLCWAWPGSDGSRHWSLPRSKSNLTVF